MFYDKYQNIPATTWFSINIVKNLLKIGSMSSLTCNKISFLPATHFALVSWGRPKEFKKPKTLHTFCSIMRYSKVFQNKLMWKWCIRDWTLPNAHPYLIHCTIRLIRLIRCWLALVLLSYIIPFPGLGLFWWKSSYGSHAAAKCKNPIS